MSLVKRQLTDKSCYTMKYYEQFITLSFNYAIYYISNTMNNIIYNTSCKGVWEWMVRKRMDVNDWEYVKPTSSCDKWINCNYKAN